MVEQYPRESSEEEEETEGYPQVFMELLCLHLGSLASLCLQLCLQLAEHGVSIHHQETATEELPVWLLMMYANPVLSKLKTELETRANQRP